LPIQSEKRLSDANTANRDHPIESPFKRDSEAERKALIRDFIGEALEPASNELPSCLMSLDNGDDVGGACHFRHLVAAVKAAAGAFKGLVAE
jgi:hypothetical protein